MDNTLKIFFALAGVFPSLTFSYKLRLLRDSKKDYSLYIDFKSFSFIKYLIIRATIFFPFSLLTAYFFDGEYFYTLFIMLTLISILSELILVTGRPHVLPCYKANFLCEECVRNKHSECVNLRSIENIQKVIRENKFTPVCCCGFVLREKVVLTFGHF